MNTPTIAQRFGDVLKKRRLSAKLSQEALSALAGCHPTYISLVERGLRNPSLDTISQLASALDCPAWKLVQESERTA